MSGKGNRRAGQGIGSGCAWEQPTAIAGYDEAAVRQARRSVRRLIEKVTVHNGKHVAADKFTVEFKSGLTVDVEG